MHKQYLHFFEDIDESLRRNIGNVEITLKIIGFVALSLAGLPERGTKDVDTLRVGKLETLSDPLVKQASDFLVKEFGKDSPSALRHGIYLDIVARSIPWLPPHPKFITEREFECINVHRLDPVDTCVSKIFSNFRQKKDRGSDKNDVLDALDNGIISFQQLMSRLCESMPRYETHAEAPEAFPRIMQFIEELQLDYGPAPFNYQLPDWMERM